MNSAFVMPEDVNPYNAGAPLLPQAAATAPAYPLSVDFQMTADDAAAAFRSGIALRPYLRQRRVLAYRLLLFGLLVAGSGLLIPLRNVDLTWLVALAVVSALLLFRGGYLLAFGSVGLRRTLTRTVARRYQEATNERLLGPRRISIDAEGIRQSAELFDASWSWKAIEQIELIDEYLLLHVGSVQSLVIPQRAFTSPGHFEAFLAVARQFHQRARAIGPAE
ncbi:MAG TPA: YcxB family protein [Pirellulales bacterium]|nr:YcxB family protein [Pirellulales bacterium]